MPKENNISIKLTHNADVNNSSIQTDAKMEIIMHTTTTLITHHILSKERLVSRAVWTLGEDTEILVTVLTHSLILAL